MTAQRGLPGDTQEICDCGYLVCTHYTHLPGKLGVVVHSYNPIGGEAGGPGSLKLAWAAEIKTQQMENQDLFRWFKAESWSSRTIRGHLCSLERQQEMPLCSLGKSLRPA